MLERFLFPGEEQYGLIGKLSGGEKRRLNLLRVLMEAPNVLILDEPTNDLDVTTLAILEDYLDSFDGIVITVSPVSYTHLGSYRAGKSGRLCHRQEKRAGKSGTGRGYSSHELSQPGKRDSAAAYHAWGKRYAGALQPKLPAVS